MDQTTKSPAINTESFMKYSSIIILCFLGFLTPPALGADQQRPEPGTAKVPLQASQPENSSEAESNISSEELDAKLSYGYVRVWNFTVSEARLAVGLLKPNSHNSTEQEGTQSRFFWLGRGLTPADTKSYCPVPVGSYKPLIGIEKIGAFTGADDESKPLTEQDNLTKFAQAIEVKKDLYLTILLTGTPENIQVQTIKDSDIPKGTKHLRAMNFTKEYKPSVAGISGDKSTIIWQEVGSNLLATATTATANANYEVAHKKPSGSVVRKSLEINLSGCRSATILIYYDRYGRFACRAVEDAPDS